MASAPPPMIEAAARRWTGAASTPLSQTQEPHPAQSPRPTSPLSYPAGPEDGPSPHPAPATALSTPSPSPCCPAALRPAALAVSRSPLPPRPLADYY